MDYRQYIAYISPEANKLTVMIALRELGAEVLEYTDTNDAVFVSGITREDIDTVDGISAFEDVTLCG